MAYRVSLGIPERHGEARALGEPCAGTQLAVGDVEVAPHAVCRLDLKCQPFPLDVLGAGGIFLDCSLQQLGQGPQQESELQHGGLSFFGWV